MSWEADNISHERRIEAMLAELIRQQKITNALLELLSNVSVGSGQDLIED